MLSSEFAPIIIIFRQKILPNFKGKKVTHSYFLVFRPRKAFAQGSICRDIHQKNLIESLRNECLFTTLAPNYEKLEDQHKKQTAGFLAVMGCQKKPQFSDLKSKG